MEARKAVRIAHIIFNVLGVIYIVEYFIRSFVIFHTQVDDFFNIVSLNEAAVINMVLPIVLLIVAINIFLICSRILYRVVLRAMRV